ncbi:unannotated protein [freshwater metagenome]|uniref:Unannotated protein n=1 Tax=freshwater metagenome TaxID=449393 RepID=A0A6J6JD73_9ZZZZ
MSTCVGCAENPQKRHDRDLSTASETDKYPFGQGWRYNLSHMTSLWSRLEPFLVRVRQIARRQGLEILDENLDERSTALTACAVARHIDLSQQDVLDSPALQSVGLLPLHYRIERDAEHSSVPVTRKAHLRVRLREETSHERLTIPRRHSRARSGFAVI